jgi:hypothetical protein
MVTTLSTSFISKLQRIQLGEKLSRSFMFQTFMQIHGMLREPSLIVVKAIAAEMIQLVVLDKSRQESSALQT